MKYSEIEVGQEAEFSRTINEDDIETFILLTDDDNSVHTKKDGIVHGMLVTSFISTLIGTKLPGDGAIWAKSNITFVQPVYVNDTITIKAMVIEKIDGGGFAQGGKYIKLYVNVMNQDDKLCVAANCLVKVPE